jgi:hypothetical protein
MTDAIDVAAPRWLPWLADAPLFIDGWQVATFNDAVIGREFRTVQMQLNDEKTTQLEKSLAAKLSVSLPKWFPWLGVGAEGQGGVKQTTGRREGENVTLQPIVTPGRQLVELALHYLVNQPDRIWEPTDGRAQAPPMDAISVPPRMLTFLDFPPKTKFLPMAAELNDGRVVTLFHQLVEKLKKDGGTLPVRYPDDTSTQDGQDQRDRYWTWFSDNWNANKAIQVIEEEIGAGGRPQWIDYRVPLDDNTTMHLHVCGRGEFDTGVFAYNFVKRGWKHGLRVVGTLKSEPDVNVLAVYEK